MEDLDQSPHLRGLETLWRRLLGWERYIQWEWEEHTKAARNSRRGGQAPSSSSGSINWSYHLGQLNATSAKLEELEEGVPRIFDDFSYVPLRGPENLQDIPFFLQSVVENEEEEESQRDELGDSSSGGNVDSVERLNRVRSLMQEASKDFKVKRDEFLVVAKCQRAVGGKGAFADGRGNAMVDGRVVSVDWRAEGLEGELPSDLMKLKRLEQVREKFYFNVLELRILLLI